MLMKRNDYGKFNSHALYDMDFRRIMMTDIYETKYYLHTVYFPLFTAANCQIYDLLNDFSLDKELEMFLNLDMLTYIPFERLGYSYLNEKLTQENSNVIEFKYNKMIKLLNAADLTVDDELKGKIDYFLENYDNDVIEINIIGLAIISLRLFHRFVTIMNFGIFVGGSMGIHQKVSATLNQITKDIKENNLKEINITHYLPEFDYNNKLSDDMIDYLEYCLEREVK